MDKFADRVTYQDLVDRYGSGAAFNLLLTVERMANIKNEIILFDEEERFQKALDALNDVHYAA